MLLTSLSGSISLMDEDVPRLSNSVMSPLPAHGMTKNMTEEEKEFWKQPDSSGYKPCLEFGIKYRKESVRISKEKRRFLIVVASGGLNQQRNQIIDAVVIARILEAALVIPVLQVNLIWGDESEFSEIFDSDHFRRTLQADVRIVSSLPSTHLVPKQSVERKIPHDISPEWIRARFFKQLNEEGVLILKGLDSKLSKNLPSDLQKLRCKVAFHALRFAAPIRDIGNKLARRMWIEGPYIALHLRLEKDVWIRTGCRTGLGPVFDRIVAEEQKSSPEYLTGRLNMTYDQRRLAGLCPLNVFEVARLLKGLGAPCSARLYVAGGEPFGGTQALLPLKKEFPDLVTKEMLGKEQELAPYINRSSALAAIDYIISLSSTVFMPSHGGNMGRAMQGHRAYVGHKKYINPNKRAMLPFFGNGSISSTEFDRIMRHLHKYSLGQPQLRDNKRGRDVIAYPVPECMCNS
ncbi:O-fucosyltransferase [Thalictrum thalictroides]|uniref:O-fucosyltransferase family protein n=1 Tax=Thalictrum thalictroides TaxID=46969 RepID=A0A7J6WAT5_THATH|nr:O-fucosyltransferase [Thalictrum thalictroides]